MSSFAAFINAAYHRKPKPGRISKDAWMRKHKLGKYKEKPEREKKGE